MADTTKRKDTDVKVTREELEQSQNHLSVAYNAGWMDMLVHGIPVWLTGTNSKFVDESALLEDSLIDPLRRTASLTALVFVSLRFGGSRTFASMRAFYKGHVMEPLVEDVVETQAWKDHMKAISEAPPRSFWQRYGIGDAFLSIIIGSTGFFYSHDPIALNRAIGQAPLMPGESLVHQHVCPPMVKIIQELAEKYRIDFKDEALARAMDREYQLKTGTKKSEKSMIMAHVLTHNCLLRETYLTRQRLKGKIAPDSTNVPFPGIKGKYF